MTVPDRVKGAVFLPVGLMLLVAGGFSLVSTRDYMRRTQTAPGQVIAEPYGSHHVTIRFRTRQGQPITYGQNGAITLHTGERVMVRYDPREPTLDPCVDQWQAIWDTTMFLGLMGSVFTAVGAGLLLAKPDDDADAAPGTLTPANPPGS